VLLDCVIYSFSESTEGTESPRLNDKSGIEQRYFSQQNTRKTGSRLQKNKVLIYTTKQQN